MKIGYIGYLIPLLFLQAVLFFISRGMPFSMDALTQPFIGEWAGLSILFAGLAVLWALYVNLFRIPVNIKEAKYFSAISDTIGPGAFGYAIGFMNQNPWIALPFILFSTVNMLIVIVLLPEKSVKIDR